MIAPLSQGLPGPGRARRVLTALGLIVCLLTLGGCASWLGRTDPRHEARKLAEAQLQQRVMRFADGYVDSVALAVARVAPLATDNRSRRLLHDFQIRQATATVQIAVGTSPKVNAIDMVVLASLTHHVVALRLPEAVGPAGQPVIDAFARLEQGAWALVDFLSPAERAELEAGLAQWKKSATSLDSVAFNRLADYARATGGGPPGDGADSSVFGLIGQDPLVGLEPAIREVEQSRQLAERALYYAQRTPMLVDLQVRTLTAALAEMPESRQMLDTSARVGQAAATLADTAARLPATMSAEREAAIRQMFQALAQQQGTMNALLVELRQSLEAGRAASDSVQGVVTSTDALLARLKVGEPKPPGAAPARPFDITEYTQAAQALSESARQLQQLIVMLERDTPGAQRLTESVRAQGESLIDYLFKRLLQAFGVLFVGVLLIVVASRWLVAHFQHRAAR